MVLNPIILGYKNYPILLSRACWDNYLTMSASTARDLGITNWNVSNGALNGSMVNITVNGTTLK